MSEIESKAQAGGESGEEALSLDYSVQRHLGPKEFQDILCAALEGGIGYWACLDNGTEAWKRARAQLAEELKGLPEPWMRVPTYDQIAARVLRNGDAVLFADAEEESESVPEELEWRLTAPALVAAAKRFQEERTAELRRRGGPLALYDLAAELDGGDFDADDADAVIQYALFGELVYG